MFLEHKNNIRMIPKGSCDAQNSALHHRNKITL